jgi:hypothetical protein
VPVAYLLPDPTERTSEGGDCAKFREPRQREVRRIPLIRTRVNRGGLPYICLHLVLLSVSGLAQAVVQVSHPIPLNDLRVL